MKRFLATCVAVSFALTSFADEGMWMISTISAHTDSVLHSMGLELTKEQLYNVDGKCLNNAIIQFDGGCSASIVSPNGLIFTNHHCGFDAIQQHSTVKHDYLKYGFVAKSYKEELPNDGMYVLFHQKTIDVTDRIMREVPDTAGLDTRNQIIDSICNVLTDEVDDEKNYIQAEINAYYKGSKYYMSVYQRFNDIRLVYAPPQCLGKYGGDTDNWMWPRQTCDFSVFRVYADKNNRPAEYSKKNKPYQTENYVHISTLGYKDGDYCMTLGYPGSTDRYLSSYGTVNTMRTENDVRYQVRTVKQDVMTEAMNSSDALRIMYASKFARSSNYWKFSLGQNQALENLGVIAEKQAIESDIQKWIDADATAHKKYVGIIDSLRVGYERAYDPNYSSTLWMESFWSGSDIVKFVVNNCIRIVKNRGELSFRDEVKRIYKDIDVPTDKKIFKALLKNYMEKMTNPKYFSDSISTIIKDDFSGNIDAYVDDLYEKSVFAHPEKLAKVKNFAQVAEDPLALFGMEMVVAYFDISKPDFTYEYERLLGDALREMNHSREYYPDANFTLRLSYGLLKPIDPTLLAEAKSKSKGQNGMLTQTKLDAASLVAESNNLTTSVESFLGKHDKNPGEADFECIAPVLDWMRAGRFSPRYLDKETGKLPLCFLTTNDITGGNSGSGMYDGKGRLIGLAFDGNWEAMSGDLKFDTNLQRCIGVDIRYVLSVIQDYSGANRLIDELTIEE